jgi:hypothetical protein
MGGGKKWHVTLAAVCAVRSGIPLMPSQSRADKSFAVSGMAFPADSVVITGEMTTYTMPGGSGEPMNRRFCARCGSPIMIDKDGTGRKLIMAGTPDDKSQFKPVVSLFCEQAPSWVVMPTDTQNLPRYYT